MSKHRYPGIHSFTTDDQDQFFGREKETKELYRLIVLNHVVVLFGKSGTGKTSLLQAGVSPLLSQRLLKPIKLRLNDTDKPISRQLWEQFNEGEFLPLNTPDNLSLMEYCELFDCVNGGESMQPVIMLDQFEELFTLYSELPKQREEFIAHLAELVNWQRNSIEKNSMGVRVVISIRSDFLYLLDRLSTRIPAILRCRYELSPLEEANARRAISSPAILKGDFITPPFFYSKTSLEVILDSLSMQSETGEGTREVEAFLLQQFCQRIESKVIEKGVPEGFEITTDFFEGKLGIETIRDAFYADILAGFDTENRLRVQKLVEEKLISGERRIIAERETLKRDLSLNDSQLLHLCQERLLREEPRGNSYYYEISHDTLLLPILRARKIRLEAEERIRTNRRIRRLIGIMFLLLLAVAGAFTSAFWALGQRNQARIALDEAQQQKSKAEKALFDFRKEQAAKMLLEFDEKARRAQTILTSGGCPIDLLNEMKKISSQHPDSNDLKYRIQQLHQLNLSCK